MRDFVDTLPLRLAAVVAALVGAVCLWNGVDLWIAAGRIGVTFVLLLMAGLLFRRVVLSLHHESIEPPRDASQAGNMSAHSRGETPEQTVDVITPGTPVGDITGDDEREDQ